MAYTVRASAPRITHQGRTFAVDTLDVGMVQQCGLFELTAAGWAAVWTTEPMLIGQFTDAVNGAGGVKTWLTAVVRTINEKLRAIFGGTATSPPPPAGDIVSQIVTELAAHQFVIGPDGVPVFQRK